MKQPQKIKYKGKEYVVKYRHVQEDGIYKGKFSNKPTRGYTEAYIQPEGEDEIGLRAFCTSKDQYNKRIGRDISCARLRLFTKKIENGTKPTPNEYYTICPKN